MDFEEINLKVDDINALYRHYQYQMVQIYIEITIYNQEKFQVRYEDFENFPDEKIVQLSLSRPHILEYEDIISLDYYIDKL